MKTKARKQQMHRARAQRKADKRRKLHKSGKLGHVGSDSLLLTARHSMVPARARTRQRQGLPKLVKQAVSRMIARHKLLTMPREGQKRDAARYRNNPRCTGAGFTVRDGAGKFFP